MRNTMPLALRTMESIHELTIRQLMRSVEAGEAVVHEESLDQAPWDTNELKETSYTTPVMVNGYRIYGYVVYPQPYALIQHENTEYNHPSLKNQAKGLGSPGGKDHYLSDPLIAYTATHLESGREVFLRVKAAL